MSTEKTYTASERASMFANATRQNIHMLPKQSNTNGGTMTFNFPKSRLLSKVILNVVTKLNYDNEIIDNVRGFNGNEIRRISIDLNNGFSPFVISGKALKNLNMVNRITGLANNVYNDTGASNDMNYDVAENDENEKVIKLETVFELPITINDRDPIGLILLQNEETNVSLVVDFENPNNIIPDVTGVFTECSVTPMIETFSIPSKADAFPDIKVLKLVNSREETFVGGGQHIVKLSTGTIYRKMILSITDENGEPLSCDDIVSNISIVFNQADSPYDINPRLLRILNAQQYGNMLPKGMYVFDFGYQGIVGLSGSRDYIDTERLTEFWIRFNTNNGCKVEITTECLAMLK